MTRRVFINYRRDDSSPTAGRLRDRLVNAFGEDNVFMDIESIPVGVDFIEYLKTEVSSYDIFLVLIGPHWLEAKDDNGRRRLDSIDDPVTVEIAAALARNTRVVPVTIDGARMPTAEQLPDSIRPLVRRNAVDVRNTHFRSDVEALIEKIDSGVWRRRRTWITAGAATLALLVGGIIVSQWKSEAPPVVVQPLPKEEGDKPPTGPLPTTTPPPESVKSRETPHAAPAQTTTPPESLTSREAQPAVVPPPTLPPELAKPGEAPPAIPPAMTRKAPPIQVRPPPTAPPREGATRNFTIRVNRDIYGEDIRSPDGSVGIPDLDINACAARCDSAQSCVAFSFNRWNRWCFPKKKIVTAQVNPRSIIAVKKPQKLPNVSGGASDIKIVHNHRFRGRPIARVTVSDLQACRAACADDSGCIAFNFLKTLRKAVNCEMFGEVQEEYIDNPNADCGWKQDSP